MVHNMSNMPLNAAAAQLGISRSALKKACRALGYDRWPYISPAELAGQERNASPTGQDDEERHCSRRSSLTSQTSDHSDETIEYAIRSESAQGSFGAFGSDSPMPLAHPQRKRARSTEDITMGAVRSSSWNLEYFQKALQMQYPQAEHHQQQHHQQQQQQQHHQPMEVTSMASPPVASPSSAHRPSSMPTAVPMPWSSSQQRVGSAPQFGLQDDDFSRMGSAWEKSNSGMQDWASTQGVWDPNAIVKSELEEKMNEMQVASTKKLDSQMVPEPQVLAFGSNRPSTMFPFLKQGSDIVRVESDTVDSGPVGHTVHSERYQQQPAVKGYPVGAQYQAPAQYGAAGFGGFAPEGETPEVVTLMGESVLAGSGAADEMAMAEHCLINAQLARASRNWLPSGDQ